jgi:hypothetical protein
MDRTDQRCSKMYHFLSSQESVLVLVGSCAHLAIADAHFIASGTHWKREVYHDFGSAESGIDRRRCVL